jgi:hypothetical protein
MAGGSHIDDGESPVAKANALGAIGAFVIGSAVDEAFQHTLQVRVDDWLTRSLQDPGDSAHQESSLTLNG